MQFSSTRVVDDARYGVVTIGVNAERGAVEVSGTQVPTVAIQRSADAELNKFVPIGTREAAHLTMSVDGVEAELRPGPGKLTRRSYRVDLVLAGTHYRFTPDSDETAELSREGAEIAVFRMEDTNGEFSVGWLADDSQPADAAIGYALSVAFRTGAMGAISMLLNGSVNVAGHS
ncbi:hypothetical protein JOF56_008446 [Kibdelosporangium banguiense]|uniref:Uncharacterized protein n=1 Tax=Kibdelosporangium banguiense TaxID=1365924 RepID=A0ABS4TVW7_9PSEU|nr:hypothetical protein [Kibdelosporangium banguiense]MBP2328061.1 hypothetical protein [Kibdelosporangium banguiense]